VSCIDAGDCTAVGSDFLGQLIYATESAGTWGAIVPLTDGEFYAVSCTAMGDCTAVGGASGSPVYVTESKGAWGVATQPPNSPGGGSLFYGVSCTKPALCTAVGKDNANQPIVATSSVALKPTVTGISPTSGPRTGGTLVTVSGTNFNGATKVIFGKVAGTNLTVVSPNEITIDSPAQARGSYNVIVQTPGGKSAVVPEAVFTDT
jgi:hypothetical protein